MIHRDVKAENILFTWRDHVLLGDFGFATRLEKADQHLTTFCGSPPYAAPELYVVTSNLTRRPDCLAIIYYGGILLTRLTFQ